MRVCLLCGQKFVPGISLLQVFSWQSKRLQLICEHCHARFQRLENDRCSICAGKLAPSNFCLDCAYWRKIYGSNLLSNQSVYRYNDAIHDVMVNYKRYGDYVLYTVLQELCVNELKEIKADYYVPVPTSPEHFKRRQFDTISAIYADLVPLTPILTKSSGSSAQGEKNRIERLTSPQNFNVQMEQRINLNNKKILLLDDIYTTGRTLYHARDALLAVFPTAKVKSFSLCR